MKLLNISTIQVATALAVLMLSRILSESGTSAWAQSASLDGNMLFLPSIEVGEEYYSARLELIQTDTGNELQLIEAAPILTGSTEDSSELNGDILAIPNLGVDGVSYWVQLKLSNNDPTRFAVTAGGRVSPEPYDCSTTTEDPLTNSITAQISQHGEWQTASPSQVGIDELKLRQITSEIASGFYTGIDSVLAVKCGFLVYEEYFNGYQEDTVHDLRSATKSITSGLIGIALDEQFIPSVDAQVSSYLNEYPEVQFWTASQQLMNIENLLTMRSGQNCDDNNPHSPGNELNMYPRYNWIQFFIEIPPLQTPGTSYSYCTAGVVTLGAVLESATGLRADVFARDYLFGELQITNYFWEYMPSGHVDTGGHIHMTPRDMLKIGQLYLQKGRWNAKQIISEEWVDKSFGQHVALGEDWYYGYLWRERTINILDVPVTYFYAQGNGGQLIYVVPALDLVMALTGSNYNQSQLQVFHIKNDIIAADLYPEN